MIQKIFSEVFLVSLQVIGGFGNAQQRHTTGKGEYLFFVNNDTIFKEVRISPISKFMDPYLSNGIASPRLLYPGGLYQMSCMNLLSLLNELHMKREMIFRNSINANCP